MVSKPCDFFVPKPGVVWSGMQCAKCGCKKDQHALEAGGGGPATDASPGTRTTATGGQSPRNTQTPASATTGAAIWGAPTKPQSRCSSCGPTLTPKQKIIAIAVAIGIVCAVVLGLGLGYWLGQTGYKKQLALANSNVAAAAQSISYTAVGGVKVGQFGGNYSVPKVGSNRTETALLMAQFSFGFKFVVADGVLPSCRADVDCQVADVDAKCLSLKNSSAVALYKASMGVALTGYCVCSLGYSGRLCEIEPLSTQLDDLAAPIDSYYNALRTKAGLYATSRSDCLPTTCTSVYTTDPASAYAPITEALNGFPTRRQYDINPFVQPTPARPGPDEIPTQLIRCIFIFPQGNVTGSILFYVPNAAESTDAQMVIRMDLPSGTSWLDFVKLDTINALAASSPLISSATERNRGSVLVMSTAEFSRFGYEVVQGFNTRYVASPGTLLTKLKSIFDPIPSYPAPNPLISERNPRAVLATVNRGYFPLLPSNVLQLVDAKGPSVDVLLAGARIQALFGVFKAGRMEMRYFGLRAEVQLTSDIYLQLPSDGYLRLFGSGVVSTAGVKLLGQAYSWNLYGLENVVRIDRLSVALEGSFASIVTLNPLITLVFEGALKIPGLPDIVLPFAAAIKGSAYGVLLNEPKLPIAELGNLPCAVIKVACSGEARSFLDSILGSLASIPMQFSYATTAINVNGTAVSSAMKFWTTKGLNVPTSVQTALDFFKIGSKAVIIAGIQFPIADGRLSGKVDVYFHYDNVVAPSNSTPFFQLNWLEVGLLLTDRSLEVGTSVFLNLQGQKEFQLWGRFSPVAITLEGAMIGTFKDLAGIKGFDVSNVGAIIILLPGPILSIAGLWGTFQFGPEILVDFAGMADPVTNKYFIEANLTNTNWAHAFAFLEQISGVDLTVAGKVMDLMSLITINRFYFLAAPQTFDIPGRTIPQGLKLSADITVAGVLDAAFSFSLITTNLPVLGTVVSDFQGYLQVKQTSLLLLVPQFRLADYIIGEVSDILDSVATVSCCEVCAPYVGCTGKISGKIPISSPVGYVRDRCRDLVVLEYVILEPFSLISSVMDSKPLRLSASISINGFSYSGSLNVPLDFLRIDANALVSYISQVADVILRTASTAIANTVLRISDICDYVARTCIQLDPTGLAPDVCLPKLC